LVCFLPFKKSSFKNFFGRKVDESPQYLEAPTFVEYFGGPVGEERSNPTARPLAFHD
jgi:hypothetical protein